MIAPAPTPLRLSNAAAVLTLAAAAAALLQARLFSFDRVMNLSWPLYFAVLATSAFAAFLFPRSVNPAALIPASRPPPRRAGSGLFGLLVVLFAVHWLVQLLPAMAARKPLPGQTIFAVDLAFALPLTGLTAWLLWRGHPVCDLLAIPMLMKVAALRVSVFLGAFYTWALLDGPFMAFDPALYALMSFGLAALIWPDWRGPNVVQGR